MTFIHAHVFFPSSPPLPLKTRPGLMYKWVWPTYKLCHARFFPDRFAPPSHIPISPNQLCTKYSIYIQRIRSLLKATNYYSATKRTSGRGM